MKIAVIASSFGAPYEFLEMCLLGSFLKAPWQLLEKTLGLMGDIRECLGGLWILSYLALLDNFLGSLRVVYVSTESCFP